MASLRRLSSIQRHLGCSRSTLGPVAGQTSAKFSTFKALFTEKPDGPKGKAVSTIKEMSLSDLPSFGDDDVTVDVSYSSLNYKDGLAVLGKPGVVREYPIVPGIDFVGTVRSSNASTYSEGDRVVLTGWGVGEKYWGGFSQVARVPSSFLSRLPDNMTEQDAMSIGTAGLTSMLCILALEDAGLTPDAPGQVLVTGASGGVGSVAVSLLSRLGYDVAAVSGRSSQLSSYLTALGATSILARSDVTPADGGSGRPLQKERWAGAVDCVGGDTLAAVLAQLRYGGAVAACGLAGGAALPGATVLPFILRGAKLLGVDSVYCPTHTRQRAWGRIADALQAPGEATQLFSSPPGEAEEEGASACGVLPLSAVPDIAPLILAGKVKGRIVVDVNQF